MKEYKVVYSHLWLKSPDRWSSCNEKFEFLHKAVGFVESLRGEERVTNVRVLVREVSEWEEV